LIFREVASNILIHREYQNAFPAKLIIENGFVRTENSNKPHGIGAINPDTFSPFPKNPVIARFFREIGRADELGSGVRNLTKYGKYFGTEKPQLIEDTIFRIIIKCPEMGINDGLFKNNLSKGVESEMARMIVKILENKALSKSEIAESLGKKRPTRYLNDLMRRLLVNEIIEYTIPEKPASRLQKYRIKRNLSNR